MRLRNILILLAVFLALGTVYYVSSKPEPAPPPEPQLYVWMVEMDDLEHIKIELPREDRSQSFIKHEDRYWYFDDPPGLRVDMARWGGGIPLLLSGPGTNRIIAENATDEKMTVFGLAQPRMEITLALTGGRTLNIPVGDSTPDGQAFYVQAPNTRDVALVDYTWFQVLERLVKDPPYPPAE
ncbi:MAG: DUF4340 domain-containing protein [Dehalococcoidales bacterium]|nr:DUF4340 domain-containing protein [Dehalococcoidales bacterium]